jgi:hypothetical protein
MFYPPSFGHRHPTQFPVPPDSTTHLSMPILPQNEAEHIIIKDINHENTEDIKDGLYRNCLVCGENSIACGWFIIEKIEIIA